MHEQFDLIVKGFCGVYLSGCVFRRWPLKHFGKVVHCDFVIVNVQFMDGSGIASA